MKNKIKKKQKQYQEKQKHLLPLYDAKLKQFCVGSIN